MGTFSTNAQYNNLIQWEGAGPEGWNQYHADIDDIARFIDDNADETYYLIFKPLGDLPSGNPLTHMKRIIYLPEKHQNLKRVIIIVPGAWPMAKAFIAIVSRVMNLNRYVTIVSNEDEAMAEFKKRIAVN